MKSILAFGDSLTPPRRHPGEGRDEASFDFFKFSQFHDAALYSQILVPAFAGMTVIKWGVA
jgi:hypothetical protein